MNSNMVNPRFPLTKLIVTTDSLKDRLVVPFFWCSTYDVRMHKPIFVIAVIALLLTGCAAPKTESQPEYDAVELALYKSCLDASYAEYIKPAYRSGMSSSSMETTKRIAGLCEHLKPVKK